MSIVCRLGLNFASAGELLCRSGRSPSSYSSITAASLGLTALSLSS